MKPLKLTMQAFGSYGKREEIDFTKPNQNLFLITGDTGAGKTTIFDAIVFAIYGEASSGNNKKDGFELQSQFADFGIQPFVELTFSERKGEADELYTVRRVPRHIRKRKKGVGITEEKEMVSLILPDGTEYSQNTRETNIRLEEIVGLNKGQFMQVAMIAQGEFMELLRAKSDDKKIIFRKLFHTGLFQNIVEELSRRRKEKLSEIAQIRTAFQTETAHIAVPEDYKHAKLLQEQKRQILSSDRLSLAGMETLLAELSAMCTWLQEKRKGAQEAYDMAREQRDEKRDAFAGAQNLLKFFEQLEQAEKDLAECNAAEDERKATVRRIHEINAAYEIRTVCQRYEDAGKAAADTEKNREEQQNALPGLDSAYREAAEQETAAREQQEQELEAFTRVSERVEKALEILDKIREARADAASKETACKAAQAEAEKAQRRLEDMENREREWRAQSEELRDADKRLALWKVKKEEAESLTVDVLAAKREQQDVVRQRQRAEKARQDYAQARQKFSDKNEEYMAKQTAFLDAQAGFLAKAKLKDGQPCPVCGSIEHPHPCVLPEDHENLTREMIDELSLEVSALQRSQQEMAAAAGTSAELLTEKEAKQKETMFRLRQRMTRSIPDVPKSLTLEQSEELLASWKQSVQEEGILCQKNADILARVEESLRRVDETRQLRRAEADQAARRSLDAKTAFARSQAALRGLEETRDYETAEEAKAALFAAKKAKEEKDAAYQRVHLAAQLAKTRKENAEALLRRYREELPAQKQILEQRQNAYEKLMAEYGLTETEWKRITAEHTKSELEKLQSRVDAHERKKAAAERMRISAAEAIGGQSRPAMEELEAARNEWEEKLSAVQALLERYREDYRINSGVHAALAPKKEERGKAVEEYNRLDSLYNRLAGKVSGSRMDIETFVQRYYLERILYAANTRFQDMSAGQFELRMYDIEKAGEGKNHGLDLMVYSTVTGREREVRTLSGGESFMAALALALGMADQIQENSAAINLDIMFIDEGFGSLDETSRNQAVKVLQQMAGGSRLIGMISHVTELKQEIEDQLMVSKDESGSHTQWRIS